MRPFHRVIALLTVGVGAITTSEIMTLIYIERRSHLGALRALGWPRSKVLKMLAGQAFALGLAGGLVASALIATAGLALGARPGAVA